MTREAEIDEVRALLQPIRRMHTAIRDAVVRAGDAADDTNSSALAAVADDDVSGDTIYAIDKIGEAVLVELMEREIAPAAPIVLIAEGLAGGKLVLPRGVDESAAKWRIIVDPIDGTRGIMYQKRSAWVLTGVAPNRGPATNLGDIVLAVQTELPLVKQNLCDSLWAVRGDGAFAERTDRHRGTSRPLSLKPAASDTIAHGYATIARFFPGAREELAAIDDEIVGRALGPIERGKAQCFEDQYAATGGQLYELACGHDRFIADLRPLMDAKLAGNGQALGLCCHPYDLCTELIARELGVIITDPFGEPLRAHLSVEPNVAWAGYANASIRRQIAPLLQSALAARGLTPTPVQTESGTVADRY